MRVKFWNERATLGTNESYLLPLVDIFFFMFYPILPKFSIVFNHTIFLFFKSLTYLEHATKRLWSLGATNATIYEQTCEVFSNVHATDANNVLRLPKLNFPWTHEIGAWEVFKSTCYSWHKRIVPLTSSYFLVLF